MRVDVVQVILFRRTRVSSTLSFFFFNDTATTEIYTLSLHDALPIYLHGGHRKHVRRADAGGVVDEQLLHAPEPRRRGRAGNRDRKSTRLNSSHLVISYAVFCLKKKKDRTDRYFAGGTQAATIWIDAC